jgi:AraC family transcriptional regulator
MEKEWRNYSEFRKDELRKECLARFELKDNEYPEAWEAVMNWFPESGYKPADGQYFEWYHNNPEEHPEKKCIVDICVPVEPL